MAKTEKPLSKTDFIRTIPREMPAQEVVSLAKEKGLSLTREMVHRIRWSIKQTKGAKGTAGKKTAPVSAVAARKSGRGKGRASAEVAKTVAEVVKTPQRNGAHENQLSSDFVHLALGIGLSRARRLLDRLEGEAHKLAGSVAD